MPRIRMYVNTGFVGAKHEDYEELPEDWNEWTEEERESYLDKVAMDYRDDKIEFGAYVAD